MRGVICVFFRKVSQIGKKGERIEKIGVNLRKTCGNFDEASGNLDEVVKVCRKCLNFYEGLKYLEVFRISCTRSIPLLRTG